MNTVSQAGFSAAGHAAAGDAAAWLLLKLAGLVDHGSEARAFLADRQVLVNGEPEQRRGRQLHPGDVVTAGAQELCVVAGPS